MNTDISDITNPEAIAFITQFLTNRRINRDFYERVPESQLDYRMVDTPERRSDSPRESILHQIYVTRKYIYGAKTGTLIFDGVTFKRLHNTNALTKQELLDELDSTSQELIELLSDLNIAEMTVKIPWSKESISAIQSLWGIESHEILHTGWNLAMMDHLNIPRYDSLKNQWG